MMILIYKTKALSKANEKNIFIADIINKKTFTIEEVDKLCELLNMNRSELIMGLL